MMLRRILHVFAMALLLAAWPLFAAPHRTVDELHLIPAPKEIRAVDGVFRLVPDGRIFLPDGVQRPEFLAAERLRDTILETSGVRYQLDRLGRIGEPLPGDVVLSQGNDSASDPDGYTLRIMRGNIVVEGNSPAGLFNGIQTLIQIAAQSGSAIPCLSIQDEPDFPNRGVYHDVSRGKVPKLDTLKWMVDYLSAMKVNQFQLYIEHPFMFRFAPEIAQNPDGLTPDEILELDQYCKDRRVMFVPSLQSFGHMAGVLSVPRFRHLADVELEAEWPGLTWHQRMSGATIDMSSPDALNLLRLMHDEYLPLFEAPYVNVCADETYDLGKGKTEALAEERGVGVIYLDHIRFLNELSNSYGKRMMFWGDIVKKYPDLVPTIPENAILLNWGYSATTDFESSKLFADAGLDFYVCPGTSGWNRIMNEVNNADLNIRRYAAAGHEHGAIGLLNTDWGDHGHYNCLAGSLHGFALGASVAWNVDTPEQDEFDVSWNYLVFGDEAARAINAMRAQAFRGSTWIAFYTPFVKEEPLRRWHAVDAEHAGTLLEEGARSVRVFEDYLARGMGERWISEELLHASRMNVMLGRKLVLEQRIEENDGAPNEELASDLLLFARDLERLHPEFERLWRARNKEAELQDITRMINARLKEARSLAEQLAAGDG